MHKFKRVLASCILLCALFSISPAFSKGISVVENVDPANKQEVLFSPDIKSNLKTKNVEPNMFNIAGSLTTVILLIFAILIVYSKINKIPLNNYFVKELEGKPTREKFNIITSVSLSPGKNLHLVEIEGKRLVLGSTATSINLLCEVEHKSAEAPVKSSTQGKSQLKQAEEIFSSEVDIYKDYIS